MAVQDKDKLVSLEDLKTAYDELDDGLNEKLDKNQGVVNVGKAMVIGSDGNLSPKDITIEVDTTLTQEGEAADAKAVGDALSHKAPVIYDTASGDIASFPDGADGLPVKDLTVGIEPVQSGSGDPSPTNVRPISGWTGCNVTRTGKNLFDPASVTRYAGTVDTDGEIHIPSNKIIDVAGKTIWENPGYTGQLFFTLICKWHSTTSRGLTIKVEYTDGALEEISAAITTSDYQTKIVASNSNKQVKRIFTSAGAAVETDLKFQIELGDFTDFTPYDGTTIPISWQSSAGTVYGGTLDVTSGVLTVTHYGIQASSMSFAQGSNSIEYRKQFNDDNTGGNAKAQGIDNIICNKYATQSVSSQDFSVRGAANNSLVTIRDSRFVNDPTGFNSSLSDCFIVYELAQPTSVTLTATEITTLLGQNNIWADCGPSTVEYPCDTKLYAAAQSDWSETDITSPAFIKNKPTIPDISQLESDVQTLQDIAGDGALDSDFTATDLTGAANELKDDVSDVRNTLNDLSESLTALTQKNEKSEIRENMPEGFIPYDYPSGFTGTYKPVAIFTDGKNFITDFDKNRFKNAGGNIMYCAPLTSGTSGSKAGTFDDPKNLFGAIRDVTDGGTVFIKPGVYSASDLSNIINGTYAPNMYKNINLIGMGDVFFNVGGDYYPLASTTGYDAVNQLYTMTRAGVMQVVDKRLFKWKKVNSIDDCKAEKGTWFKSGTTVYLNSNGQPDVFVQQSGIGFSITPTNGLKLYFENITIIGGKYSAFIDAPTSGEIETIWVGCKFLFGTTDSSSEIYNAFRFCGNKCLCVDCEASFALKDGFGYNEDTGIQFVEIGCIGSNNGDQDYNSVANCNGSTSHQGAKGIRVNGFYYNNFGANIADVHSDTQTINLGCVVESSDKAAGDYCQGISAQQSGAEMWVDNCKAFNSIYDIYCASGATMHLFNTCYYSGSLNGTVDQTGGYQIGGTDDINDYKTPGSYMYIYDDTSGLSNCPASVRFALDVLSMGIYVIQRITTANDIYLRRSGYNSQAPGGYGWREWYKITGTIVT